MTKKAEPYFAMNGLISLVERIDDIEIVHGYVPRNTDLVKGQFLFNIHAPAKGTRLKVLDIQIIGSGRTVAIVEVVENAQK